MMTRNRTKKISTVIVILKRGAAQGHELRAMRDRRRRQRQRADGGIRQVTHQGVRSVVDIEGAVSFPKEPHVSTTHQV